MEVAIINLRNNYQLFLTQIFIDSKYLHEIVEKLCNKTSPIRKENKNWVGRNRVLLRNKTYEDAQENMQWRTISREAVRFTLMKGETRKGLGFSSAVDILLADKTSIFFCRLVRVLVCSCHDKTRANFEYAIWFDRSFRSTALLYFLHLRLNRHIIRHWREKRDKFAKSAV